MSDNEELEDQLPPQQEANEDGEAEAQGEGEPGEGAAGLVEGEADEEDEAEYQDSSEVSAWSRCSRRHGEADRAPCGGIAAAGGRGRGAERV